MTVGGLQQGYPRLQIITNLINTMGKMTSRISFLHKENTSSQTIHSSATTKSHFQSIAKNTCE